MAAWTNAVALLTWSAGARSISAERWRQTDGNSWQSSQPPTSHSHAALLGAVPRALVINLPCSLHAALKTGAAYRFPDHATGPQNDTVE